MAKIQRSRNQKVTIRNTELSLSDLSIVLGIKESELLNMLNSGMKIDDIKKLKTEKPRKTPMSNKKLVLPNGQSLLEYCIENGLNFSCIYYFFIFLFIFFMSCTSFSYVLLRLNHCHVSKYAAPSQEGKGGAQEGGHFALRRHGGTAGCPASRRTSRVVVTLQAGRKREPGRWRRTWRTYAGCPAPTFSVRPAFWHHRCPLSQ